MSPRSGRKKIAQGGVSEANETLGIVTVIVQSGLLNTSGRDPPGFRCASPGATICHPLRGFEV
ncbi:MAG: hypothetical protein QOG23_3006 [Blastocatellia bacterium]|jgi:hypothetical protein|nr:hypothetical protein [Blastocatellia bacterium]